MNNPTSTWPVRRIIGMVMLFSGLIAALVCWRISVRHNGSLEELSRPSATEERLFDQVHAGVPVTIGEVIRPEDVRAFEAAVVEFNDESARRAKAVTAYQKEHETALRLAPVMVRVSIYVALGGLVLVLIPRIGFSAAHLDASPPPRSS